MGLTQCHLDRRPVYAEHDGNRLVRYVVREAKAMGAATLGTPAPACPPLPPIEGSA
jgi:hypothetical protein